MGLRHVDEKTLINKQIIYIHTRYLKKQRLQHKRTEQIICYYKNLLSTVSKKELLLSCPDRELRQLTIRKIFEINQ